MVRIALSTAIILLLALTTTASGEQRTPGSGGLVLKPLVQTRPATVETPSRYSRTYSEQVARSLGLRDGGLDLLRPQDRASPYAPSVSFTGNMLRLRW